MQHHLVSESGTPTPSEGSLTGEDSCPPAKIRKVEPDLQANQGKSESEEDTAPPATSPAQTTGDSYAEHEESPSEPKPVSSPCTCYCNGCCCHGTSSEPQHCVRCHTDYRLNYPEACMVPHVFTDPSNYGWDDCVHGDVSAPSVCCGAHLCGGDPRKGDWEQPFPCSMGWHTTDVDVIKEQYNGINVLRCNLGPGGKCLRIPMKHSARYQLLYDERVKYIQIDEEDHQRYLKRKREQINDDDTFEELFIIKEMEDYAEDEEEDKEEKMMKMLRNTTRKTPRIR